MAPFGPKRCLLQEVVVEWRRVLVRMHSLGKGLA